MPVLADELARLQAHRWQISDLAFSPDGSRLASAGWDKEVNVWELSDLEKAVTLSGVHQVPITSVSWLRPNGEIICTGSADHSAALWRAQNGQYLSSLTDHAGWVLGTDFSANGAFLATASWDKVVRIWDPGTETLINSLAGHSDGVWDVKFHPSSPLLCSAGQDGSVRVWDARTSRPVATLYGGHSEAVYCATWSSDGGIIASGSADSKVCIWEPGQKAVVNTIYAHQDTVKSLAFNPQTENVAIPVLASAGGYNLSLSDPRPSHRANILSLSLHQKGKEVEAVAISPDGSLLVSGGRDGRIVLMTLMVPSVIPRSESNQMDLTSSVLRKSRIIRNRSYICDVTSDGEIPLEREEEEEEEEEDWIARQQEEAEMMDTLEREPKKVERQTSIVRLKRQSRFEEKETELADYATVRKKVVNARTARERRAKGKSYDIPTMVAHLSAAVRVYGPEEPNSSSDSEGEENTENKKQGSHPRNTRVDILSHIKAWSHPESISSHTMQAHSHDLPGDIRKTTTNYNKKFFETGSLHLREDEEEEKEEEKKEEREEGYFRQFDPLSPDGPKTSQQSHSPTNFDAESLLHQSGHYNLGNSYRLEDLMAVNSEELLPQWNTSPFHNDSSARVGKRHTRDSLYNPTLPTQLEHQEEEEDEEEEEEDNIPLSMI